MGSGSNYHNISTHPRLGTGVQYHDPDMDNPWWCHNVTLPNDARCETCLYWEFVYGVCGLDTRRVTLPESRCMSWDRHPRHKAQVEAAAARWRPKDGLTAKAEGDRDRRKRERIQRNATR